MSIPQRLNPFSRLPNPREVWAWGMYDLANQSFQLLINTLLFSLFIQTVVVGDQVKGDRAWSMLFSVALIAVVIISPFAGALADARAWKRELLFASGVVCAALTAALALLAPGQLWLAALLYIPAAIACGLGENFLGSFLPEISTPKNVGFVSALGWSMSYVGALLLVAITAAAIYAFAWTERDTRPLFVFAGLWFFLGMVPSMFHLKERAQPSREPGTLIVTQTFRRLVRSARETRRFGQLVRFFIAAFVYSMGTLAVISFLGLIGKNLGFQLPQLMLFALVTSLAAGIAAALTAKFQDRLGHRCTISVFLGVWVASTGGLALSRMMDAPSWTFWIVAAGVGVALGGIGTSSRAMVGAFTPEDRAGEFFGLWGMIYKLAGVVGVMLFGQVSTAFATTEAGQIVGLLMLAGFFLAGLGLTRFVNEAEGVAAASDGGLMSNPSVDRASGPE